MKLPLREYLTLAAALLAILLCGYGIGFLVGERTTQQRLAAGGGPQHSAPDWESATLGRLTAELGLDDTQQQAVRQEIHAASQRIAAARGRAVADYRRALLDLHQQLLPHLTEPQRKQVEESRRLLEKLLDSGE